MEEKKDVHTMKDAIKRAIIVAIGVSLQILLGMFINIYLMEHIFVVNIFYIFISFLLTLSLIKDSKNYSYTLPWIIIVLLFPIFGTLMYIVLGNNIAKSKTLKSIVEHEKTSKKYLIQDEQIAEKFENNGRLKYISNFAGFPVTTDNEVKYYPLGELAFEAMKESLREAKKFIFFEYFIVCPGKMWGEIFDILKQKAHEGLDVRVMYDDMGCISTLKSDYPKRLVSYGIKCISFNRLNPISGLIMNHRDHRKILIIDGKVAFSGGINIADEYINLVNPYGLWKDNAFKIEGNAVWNFTVMFLTMWNSSLPKDEDVDYTKFKYSFPNRKIQNGFTVPYGETPLDKEVTGEDIYLNIINQATKYVYIFTPYLIIDTDMINSLILAAKRGVDVRLVIPGIPDKKIVYTLSESYVTPLVKGGVKVYKYTPGFVHSKVFVADDQVATVGTINLDYRSLYLHFECGCYFENCDVVATIKEDLVNSIDQSHQVTKEEAEPSLIKAIWQAILRLIAPLM